MSIPAITSLLDEIRRLRLLDAAQLKEISRRTSTFRDAKSLAHDLVRRRWLSAYQAGQLVNGKGGDLVLGSYLILDQLGEGGMGQVFKARHREMNRLVALKVIRKELAADAEIVARFYREMQLTSQLHHRHLVQAYDAGPLDGTHFLTMEYVDGIDLDRLVEQSGPLPVEQAVDYIRQAAVGLQCIHEHGLVHRDIKPSNLLRTPDGVVKILDLGLARLQETIHGKTTTKLPDGKSLTTLTLAGSVTLGTVDFLAPEQALDFHTVDIRGDIYSLGCTFYYLLAGQPPFGEGTLAVKLMKHQQFDAADIRQVRPEVPRSVAQVIRRMLAKRPEARYQTPADVVEALSGSAGKYHPRLKWVAAALVAVAIGAGVLWLGSRSSSDAANNGRPTRSTEPMRNIKLQELGDNAWARVDRFRGKERGAWEVPWTYDPDLRRLVRVGGRVPDHSNEVWTFDLGTLQWNAVLPFANDPSAPTRGLANRPGYGSERASCYDLERHCLWEYTGTGAGRAGSRPGLWKGVGDLTAANWTFIPEVPSTGHSRVAYDEHARKVVCLGTDMSSFGRTFVYDPETGQSSSAPAGPNLPSATGRVGLPSGSGFLYVPELKGCLLFGILPDRAKPDNPVNVITWLFDATTKTWRDLAPAGPLPSPRAGFGFSYDRQNRVIVLFGGGTVPPSPAAMLADLWIYDPVRNAWSEVRSAGGPSIRRAPTTDCQMFAYDEEHNVHVLGLVDRAEDSGVWVYRYRR